jgi:hypothetical protein
MPRLRLVITDKGLEKRFDARGAAFLRAMLQAAISKAIASPVAIPLLRRFTAVEVLDGSTIALPDALAHLFRGGRSGTTTGAKAAVKITVGLDLVSGRLSGPELSDGRAADLSAALAVTDPPAGALHLADLNYFSLEKFTRWGACGAYWLSRFKSGTAMYDTDGRRIDLVASLRAAGGADVDRAVVLGSQRRMACRLIARRVPAAVATQRRQRLLDKSQRRGDRPSALSLALCEWTILVTNVPRDLLNVEEAIALARMRWQIELIFKLWKSHGEVDQWCGDDPDSALCQLYGKLLAQVVQHWVIVAGAWSLVDRSLTKAARVVRDLALSLAAAMRRRTAVARGAGAGPTADGGRRPDGAEKETPQRPRHDPLSRFRTLSSGIWGNDRLAPGAAKLPGHAALCPDTVLPLPNAVV